MTSEMSMLILVLLESEGTPLSMATTVRVYPEVCDAEGENYYTGKAAFISNKASEISKQAALLGLT